MTVRKIAFVIAVLVVFAGCVAFDSDNFDHSGYIDPNGAVRHLHWFDITTPVFALIALVLGITIKHESRSTD